MTVEILQTLGVTTNPLTTEIDLADSIFEVEAIMLTTTATTLRLALAIRSAETSQEPVGELVFISEDHNTIALLLNMTSTTVIILKDEFENLVCSGKILIDHDGDGSETVYVTLFGNYIDVDTVPLSLVKDLAEHRKSVIPYEYRDNALTAGEAGYQTRLRQRKQVGVDY